MVPLQTQVLPLKPLRLDGKLLELLLLAIQRGPSVFPRLLRRRQLVSKPRVELAELGGVFVKATDLRKLKRGTPKKVLNLHPGPFLPSSHSHPQRGTQFSRNRAAGRPAMPARHGASHMELR